MKRIVSALFALLCAASAFAAPFQNGSFEVGTLAADPCNAALPIGDTSITGWTVVQGDVNYLTTSCWTPSDGARSLDLVGNGSKGGVQQTFDTVPGQTYQLIFDLAGNPSTGFPPAVKNMSVTVDGVTHDYTFDTSNKTTSNMEWIAYSFLFVAAGPSTTIAFVSDMTGSSFAGAALDNVRVQAVTPLAEAWTDVTPAGNVRSGTPVAYPNLPRDCTLASNWTTSGGPFTYPLNLTGSGLQGTVIVSYAVPEGNSANGICGSWSTAAEATFSGDVSVLWDYRGDHESAQTSVDLQAFVIRASAPDTVDTLVSSTSGTKFQHGGQYTVHENPGDIYGFAMTGSNVDPADALFGTLTVVIVSPPAAPPSTATPVLIGVLATDSTHAILLGRLDGIFNTDVSLEVLSASTCSGLVPPVALLPGSFLVHTDANGYFFTDPNNPIAGIPIGGFAAARVAGASTQSNCLVSSADNDSWPGALLVSNANPIQGYLDAPGKARWYKFDISPGQRIDVTLSGLPADYDLAIFKDVYQAFLSQLASTTPELTKLTAEFAPSMFSPSMFSPSMFSPSMFSPDAYAPSMFSPSMFSEYVFSPSMFSPSMFSPSMFSPSMFSPSMFSPSMFSPSMFSPSMFSPSMFSPSFLTSDEIAQAFSSAQTRSLLGVSATAGTGNEAVSAFTWNNTGQFYVRVVGRSGAFSTSSPFTIAVQKGATTCAGVTDTTPPSRGAAAALGLKTLVVTDSSNLLGLDDPLPGGGTLHTKLNAFIGRPEIAGLLIDIAPDARVGVLKTQAANHLDCPFAKNLVAREIKAIIDSYRANNPDLHYVVIAGNDGVIPFFRYPDETLIGSESEYVPPVFSTSASEASLRGNFVLGQDAYGSTQVISLRSTDFPIPGLAVGRLVETPADMAGLIDAYTTVNGVFVPLSSLVTGYDFLQDAADAVSSELAQGTGNTPDKLIAPNGISPQDPASWTAADLRAKLNSSSRYDVMYLAGHFSANSLLAADFTTGVITTELSGFLVDLTNSIVFSAGCHSGYNIVDPDAITGVTLALDWAQAFAQRRATLIAGTGYQYGDTDFLEYSERLYRNFARQLRAGTGPVAVGDALVRAKQDYLAATPDIRGLHQKALLEATVFGLPMLSVDMPTGRTPNPSTAGVITPVAAPPGTPAATLGLKTYDLPITPALTTNVRALTPVSGTPVTATWLSGPDGIVTNPAEPALPLAQINVTPTDSSLVLRGIGFRGGNYNDLNGIVPLTGSPTTDLRGVHVPFLTPFFYPMRLATPNYFGSLSGSAGTNLLVTPAQHRAYDIAQGTSTLRSFSTMNFKLYYSGLTTTAPNGAAALSAAPTIVQVAAVPSGAGAIFTAQVVGDPAAAIYEVWVTYTGGAGGTWTSVNLQQCIDPPPPVCGTTSDSQFWMGEVASLPANTSYIVQAASGVGLVSLDDNLGNYYAVSSTAPVATTVAFSGSVPANVAFGANTSITATLTAGASPLANKLVTIAVGGGGLSGVTNAAGNVTVAVPVTVTPGTYLLKASFAGDAGYLPASVSTSLTVTQAPTSLTALSSGNGATLTASVGAGTQPLIQETVRFSVTGPVGPLDVFAITDYLGRATVPPPGLPAGTYTISAAHFDGNTNYAPSDLSVAGNFCSAPYQFSGFFQPVDNPPTLNTVKAGQSVPVKFSLSGNCGLNIFDPRYPLSQTISCGGFASVDAVEQTVTANASSLQYSSTTDQYTYVWKTDKAWAGTCRVLIFNFKDGSQRRANFQFKS